MTPEDQQERGDGDLRRVLRDLGTVAYTVRLRPDVAVEFISENAGRVLGIDLRHALDTRPLPRIRSQDGHLLEQLVSMPVGMHHEFVLRISVSAEHDIPTGHWARTSIRPDGSLAVDGVFRVLPDLPTGFERDAAATLALMIDELSRSPVPNRKVGVLSVTTYDVPLELEGLIAQRLRHSVRGDDVVVRVGEGSYTVLVGRLRDALNALDVANVVLDSLLRPIEGADASVHPTASVGIAVGGVGADPGAAISRADEANSSAADLGRNRVSVHHDDIDVGLS